MLHLFCTNYKNNCKNASPLKKLNQVSGFQFTYQWISASVEIVSDLIRWIELKIFKGKIKRKAIEKQSRLSHYLINIIWSKPKHAELSAEEENLKYS